MVQIIPKARSFGEEFARALGSGASGFFEERGKRQQEAARSKTASAFLGMDVSGYDPETIRGLVVEKLKQKGKESRQKEDQEFLSRLFLRGQKQQPSSQIAQELIGQRESDEKPEISQDLIQEQSFDPSQITDEDILIATSRNPNLGKVLQAQKDTEIREKREEKKEKRTQFEKDREYHTQFSKPVEEEARKVLESASAKKGIMNQWRRDIASGETSGFGQFMVDKTGLEFWRNPESARFKAAGKEYFVESLRTIAPGAKPNIFIEQQLASAQPALGRDIESGSTVLEMQQFLDDLKEEKAKLIQKFAEEDEQKYGYTRKNINDRAQKALEPYAQERQRTLAYNIRKIHEDQMDDKALAEEITMGRISPQTPLTERAASILMLKNSDNVDAAIREAQKIGFELPKKKK